MKSDASVNVNPDNHHTPDGHRLQTPLQALATAQTKKTLWNILDQYPDLLASWADGILTQLVQAAWQRQQMDILCIFAACRAFLARCRQIGSEDALAEQQTLPLAASSPLAKLLQLPKDDTSIPHRIPLYRNALSQVRRETEQELWATLQYELADCLARSQGQDRAHRLEEAIRRYRAVLEVWTQDNSPEKWAQVLHDLGSAFRLRVHGDRRENLKRAIKLYELALQVRACEAHPNGWAATQICLGIAWKDLPDGNRKENQERALKHYQSALKVWSRKANPVGWARVQHNLGNLCSQFVGDDRVTNLERALKHYRLALKIRSRDAHPIAWAMTQVAMANTYVERIRGDRAENLDRAIELYQQALEVRTCEARPAEWAETQYDLAVAYRKRIRGDRAENQEEAIKHYRLALEVHTCQAFPEQWATAQTDLGLVYYRRLYGDRAENLERAIKLFTQALEVTKCDTLPEQWATTQLCLANAYCDRIQGDCAENLEQAIKHYNLALEVRTRETFPHEWAMIQNNLGTAYWERLKGHRMQNIKQAIQLFNEALEIHTPDAFPVDARRAARNLGNLFFGEGRWTEAHAAYTTALQAAKALYTAAFMEAGREAEISENATLYAHDAFCLAHLGQLKEALVQLEEGKTRTLAERLGRDAAQLEKVRPKDQKTYRKLVNHLKALEAEQRAGGDDRSPARTGRPYTEIAGDVKQARKELDTLTQRMHGYLPDFLPVPLDFAAIQALVPDEQTALVEFCVTEKGSVVLVIRREEEPVPVWIKGFTQADLSRTVHNWVAAYLSRDHTRWRATIERVLNEIGLRLVAPLHTVLQKCGITRLILIPQSSLFLLPLHAAWIAEDGACLLDRYEVSYAPSAAVLQRCRERAVQTYGQGLFAVTNPQEDPNLVFTLVEGENIARLFPKDQRVLLEEHEGTKKAVLRNAKGRGYLHFSCHGTYDWREPLQSGLFLADPDRLTLEDLQRPSLEFEGQGEKEQVEVDMSAAHLVTLSACETGITEATTSRANEYVGLPAGFMLAGVPCVVSSLWSVQDLSTALLMERFYVNHLGDPDEDATAKPHLPPAEALRQAEIWLRDEVTAQEAAKRCDEQIDRLESKGEDAPAWLSRAWREYAQMARKTPDRRPFAHPFHWAAFAIYGATQDPRASERNR